MPLGEALITEPRKCNCFARRTGVGTAAMLSEPLLAKKSKQGVNEGNNETEEPEDVDLNIDGRDGEYFGLGNGVVHLVIDILEHNGGSILRVLPQPPVGLYSECGNYSGE